MSKFRSSQGKILLLVPFALSFVTYNVTAMESQSTLPFMHFFICFQAKSEFELKCNLDPSRKKGPFVEERGTVREQFMVTVEGERRENVPLMNLRTVVMSKGMLKRIESPIYIS